MNPFAFKLRRKFYLKKELGPEHFLDYLTMPQIQKIKCNKQRGVREKYLALRIKNIS